MQYHRLMRQQHYRWWRPLAEVSMFLIYGAVLFFGFLLAVAGIEFALTPEATPSVVNSTDMYKPGVFIGLIGSLGVLVPAALLCVRWPGRRPGFLWSVAGGIRWRLLSTSVLVSGVAYAVLFSFHALFSDTNLRATEDTWILLIAALVLVPFQAAAEELLFRGLIPQLLGAYKIPAVIAYAVPIPLFTIGHDYNWIGLLDIVVFAVCMSWLTHRSGGIELAIGIHTVGNVAALVSGVLGIGDLNQTEIPWNEALLAICATIAITIAVDALRRRVAGESQTEKPELTGEQMPTVTAVTRR